jgi:hypothetical protein
MNQSASSKHRRGSTATSDPIFKMFMGPSRAETTRLVEEANAELVGQTIDTVMVDRLFAHSTALSGAGEMLDCVSAFRCVVWCCGVLWCAVFVRAWLTAVIDCFSVAQSGMIH